MLHQRGPDTSSDPCMPNRTKRLTANESGQLLSNSTPQSRSQSISKLEDGIGLEGREIIVGGGGGLKAKIYLTYQKVVFQQDSHQACMGVIYWCP